MSAPLADTRALARIARRIADAVEEETACFEAGLPPRGADFSDRKALLLLEFTRAARGCAPPFDERLREALARMKAAVARNHAVLGLHLEAARRVAETLKRVVADIESDGTYAATRLVRGQTR
jgi:hypothetical protein